MILPDLYISETNNKGRGVFTRKDLPANVIIENAPVIVMSNDDRQLLDKTLLHDYIFEWGDDSEKCCMALGYVPMYNHAVPSNCEYEMDYENHTIAIKTVRPVKAGDELFINYNGDWDNDTPLWFTVY